jgi:ubiquitin C-terminal hydrolase
MSNKRTYSEINEVLTQIQENFKKRKVSEDACAKIIAIANSALGKQNSEEEEIQKNKNEIKHLNRLLDGVTSVVREHQSGYNRLTRNKNNSCFVDAMLMALVSIKAVRDLILNRSWWDCLEVDRETFHLCMAMDFFITKERSKDMTKFAVKNVQDFMELDALAMGYNIGTQQDVQEVFQRIYYTTALGKNFANVFGITSQVTTQCHECGMSSISQPRTDPNLVLFPRGEWNLNEEFLIEDLLKGLSNGEVPEGYCCERCGSTTDKKKRTFETFHKMPDVLPFFFGQSVDNKKSYGNGMRGFGKPFKTKLTEKLDLSSLLKLHKDVKKDDARGYELKSVILRSGLSGNKDVGHFTAYVLWQNVDGEEAKWVYFDDLKKNQLKEVGVEDVLSTTAYMAFYAKK